MDEEPDFDLTKRFPAPHPGGINPHLEFRSEPCTTSPRRTVMAEIGTYTKAIAAAVVAAGTTAVTALQDGQVEPIEWATIAGAFFVALMAVWAIPNVPESVRIYGKAITSGLVSLAAGVGTAYLNGVISPDEWVTIGIAFVTGLGLVAIAPNARESDDPPQEGGDPVDDEDGEFRPDLLPSDEAPTVEPNAPR